MAYDNGLQDHLFLNVRAARRSDPAVPVADEHLELYNEVLAEYIQDFADSHPSTLI
jgi:hypothetical protein